MRKGKSATMISEYALALSTDEDVKYQLYEFLDRTTRVSPRNEKTVLLGNFNTRAENQHHTWNTTIR